jgi:ribosomal protein L11 methyltransferase
MNSKPTKEWHAVTITVPREGSDWISHLLFEMGSVGNLEEEAPDPTLIAMRGYFPTEVGPAAAIIQQITTLLKDKGIEPLSTFSTTIKIQNWAEQAKQLFTPIKILDDTTIINPWSDYKASDVETTVTINPGMAFGTGFHATTRLAARLTAETITSKNVKTMCDVGAGSAILSIIAAKRGASKIDAVEIDTDARKSATENIEANRCSGAIRILTKIDEATGKYSLVVANILCSIILELKEDLITRLIPGGSMVISGVTTEEDERFRELFSDPRLELIEKREDDGWMGYLFVRTGKV